MTWRQKWIRKFSDFFLEIFGNILTSSVVLAHLRPVFGSLEKYWNNLKLLENGQKLQWSFWGPFCFFLENNLLSQWIFLLWHVTEPNKCYQVIITPIETFLLLYWWQNYIKTLSSVVDRHAQWAQVSQNSKVSFQMSEQYRLCAPSLQPQTDFQN